ncbi:Methenyltetrahydromethanopterin cyclohydrolase [Rubripirellula tenax]|uniref:Methenyltetrahydromethanopterin cyclohydrolase n=1 Tax=Rubripirellula tenax TaxID=2528015 RepID=A0A5C6EMT3_9BACT|nr:methenyltetrahydromethanopterin cyclohydrolase [Rubripirellula tenax]TWU48619.1 Methenyltetrahydromethanopterin cyclohydrolase [Rubripirellula tenax]
MLNELAHRLFSDSLAHADDIKCRVASIGGGHVLDAGVETPGSIAAGIVLARLCLGDRASVSLHPADANRYAVSNSVYVRTDDPLRACLGAQYAGWPVQTDDYFAMGSGPMRMFRGREATLKELSLSETGDRVVGVVESDKLPTESAIAMIAGQCGVDAAQVHLAVAPSTSIAGSIQVVARSVETAMHKLHELKFDVTSIVSATGLAPLPPPAKPGDTVGGIGRTNDAMLYGAEVVLWVDTDDDAIAAVADKVPSQSSKDHGRPFAEIFKGYEYDFYKVDPMLFSPAVVTIHNLRSGRTWSHGEIQSDVLRRSFLA